MKLPIANAACLLLLTPFGWAAETSDSDLVKGRVAELKSRQPPNEVQENNEVVASHIERTEGQQVVDVPVTEAEGRRVAGRCIIRNGKVFDYKG